MRNSPLGAMKTPMRQRRLARRGSGHSRASNRFRRAASGLYDVDGSRFGVDDIGRRDRRPNSRFRDGRQLLPGASPRLAPGPFDGTTVTAFLGAPKPLSHRASSSRQREFLIGLGLRDNRNVLARYPSVGAKPELLTLTPVAAASSTTIPIRTLCSRNSETRCDSPSEERAPQQLLTIGTSELAGSGLKHSSVRIRPTARYNISERGRPTRAVNRRQEVSPKRRSCFRPAIASTSRSSHFAYLRRAARTALCGDGRRHGIEPERIRAKPPRVPPTLTVGERPSAETRSSPSVNRLTPQATAKIL